MEPSSFFICRFAAEPPQLALPADRWAQTLANEFEAVYSKMDTTGIEMGDLGSLTWYSDRSWNGRTYVPVTSQTSTGEIYGFVSFSAAEHSEDGVVPADFRAWVDFSDQTAADHPEWKLNLCDEVIGQWHGEGALADMTLVWGRALLSDGVMATAQLGTTVVDQCQLVEDRFTLIAPDAYRDHFLDIALWDDNKQKLAQESLYEDETQSVS